MFVSTAATEEPMTQHTVTDTPATPAKRRAAIRSLQSGTIGAIVEWYEYTV
jgi:hypothetical protein